MLCEDCFELEMPQTKEKYSFVKAVVQDLEEIAEEDPAELKKHLNNDEIDKLVEEYYMLDFEDLIAGGLKTRFKYIETEP